MSDLTKLQEEWRDSTLQSAWRALEGEEAFADVLLGVWNEAYGQGRRASAADIAQGKVEGAIEELEGLDVRYGEHPDEREDDIRARLAELRKEQSK